MNKFYEWLVVSSADPEKWSMTFKGVLLQYVAMAILVLQLVNIPFTETQLVEFIGMFAGVCGTLLAIFGLVRKVYFQIKGYNTDL